MANGKKITWQGVGISSDPALVREPLSLHMLAYLQYGSNSSQKHLVVVGDMMQAYNYMAFHGLSNKRAQRLAAKKGKNKTKDLKRLCSAYNLRNVSVVRFEKMQDEIREVRFEIDEAIKRSRDLKEIVLSTIPTRMKRNCNESTLELLSQYVIDELSMALHLGGTRISHSKQKAVDDLTKKLQGDYGIGKKVNFDYPKLGLEYEPKTGLRVEPYSAISPESRLLVTDSSEEFVSKVNGVSDNRKRKILSRLRKAWNVNLEDLNRFYERVVEKGHTKLILQPARRIATATLIASAFLLFNLGTLKNRQESLDHQSMSVSEFKQKYEQTLPPSFLGLYNVVYGDGLFKP